MLTFHYMYLCKQEVLQLFLIGIIAVRKDSDVQS